MLGSDPARPHCVSGGRTALAVRDEHRRGRRHAPTLALDSLRLTWHTIRIQGDAGVMFVMCPLTVQPTGCKVGQLFDPASLRYPYPHPVSPAFPPPPRDHSRS